MNSRFAEKYVRTYTNSKVTSLLKIISEKRKGEGGTLHGKMSFLNLEWVGASGLCSIQLLGWFILLYLYCNKLGLGSDP